MNHPAYPPKPKVGLLGLAVPAYGLAGAPGWPPYNIERFASEDGQSDTYRIEVAVAGFRPDQLNIEVKENVLTVTGKKDADDSNRTFLHRGSFTFPVLMGDADLGNLYGGILGFPVTVLIARDGTVAARFEGETDLAAMEKQIQSLLAAR